MNGEQLKQWQYTRGHALILYERIGHALALTPGEIPNYSPKIVTHILNAINSNDPTILFAALNNKAFEAFISCTLDLGLDELFKNAYTFVATS